MNKLEQIFAFSEAFPLIFTQAGFWIFFASVYLVFSLIYKKLKLRNTYLFVVSLFFYYKTSGLFVGLLLFTIIITWLLGNLIFNSRRLQFRQLWLALSILINLFVLAYFKYAYFFTDSFNELFHTHLKVTHWLAEWGNSISRANYFTVDKIILPIGISFYTFQALTYCADIFRGKLQPLKSVIDFGFFVSFFPQLVAGPIVRAGQFIPQINKPTAVSDAGFNTGTYLILKGLIKKMIFADFIAMHFLDKVFDAPAMFSGFANLMAMIGYSLQIYGDFSGYTDIAIGLALLMGFSLPINFNSPYKALNTSDFWKRWHISLSSFLKDYLYIPLGGNRNGSVASVIITALLIAGFLLAINQQMVTLIVVLLIGLLLLIYWIHKPSRVHFVTNINLMLTMLIGGLWHGASWKFVIWGGLNGLGILVYKYWRKISPWEQSRHRLSIVWKITLTFVFITFTRIYFRGESMDHIAIWYRQVSRHMDWSSAVDLLLQYKLVFGVMLIGYITHWLPYRTKDLIAGWYGKSHIAVKVLAVVLTAVVCYQAYSASFQPFIYFQF